MATKVRIKSKVASKVLGDKDVLEMFDSVLGTKSSPLHITYPKYNNIKHHVERFIDLLDKLHNSSVMESLPTEKQQLMTHLTALFKQFAETFVAPDFAEFFKQPEDVPDEHKKLHAAMFDEPRYDMIPNEVRDEFDKIFEQVKSSDLVKSIIVTCSNLSVAKYHTAVTSTDDAKLDVLLKKPPMKFSPICGLDWFNLKQIYISDTVKDKKLIIVFIRKLYEVSHAVYEAVNTPDIDVGEFVNLVMSSIDDVKKMIPRCDDAFTKIKESVGLLKGNFGSYYKDYVASSNPTIIMENFVIDVSKSTQATPKLTQQFRKIISYYKNITQNQNLNPKLQSVFKHVDNSFNQVEKEEKEGGEEDEGDEGSETAEEKKVAAAPGTEVTSPPTGKDAKKKKKNQKKNARNRAKQRGKTTAKPDVPLQQSNASKDDELSLADELAARPDLVDPDETEVDDGETLADLTDRLIAA